MANFSLLAKMGLDTKAFQTGLDGANKKVSSFRKSLSGLKGTLGTIGFTAAVNRAAEYVTQMQNSARLAGLASEEFQKFAFATKRVGIEQEKAADILKDVSDKVGDFLSTGAGGMADFFEKIAPKVGVTAEQFRDLNGRDALQLYVSSLEKANVSQNEMTFYLEAIASDASALLPLLKNNSKELNNLANAADRVGAVIDTRTADSIKNMKDSFDTAGQAGIAFGAKIFGAGQKVFEGMFAVAESVRTGNNVIGQLAEKSLEAEWATIQLSLAEKAAAEVTKNQSSVRAEYNNELDRTLITVDELNKLEDGRRKMLEDLANIEEQRLKREQEAIDKKRELFLQSKELEALQLRAAGKNAEAEALEKQIKMMKEAIKISRQYGISLKEAADLVKGNKTPEEKESKKLKQLELELIRARAAGEKELTKELERKINILRSALQIQKEHNISLEEAFKLAKKINDQNGGEGGGDEPPAEDTRGDMARGLRGEDLRKAANAAGKEDNIRFDRMADGTFQQFVKGKKGKVFSEAEMQAGLQKQIDKGGTEGLLEKINKTLEGKFVSQ